MRHFLKLAENVNIRPLLTMVYQQPSLWNQVPLRTQTQGSPHLEVDDILLRLQPLDGSCADKRECVDYAALDALPPARDLIHALMAAVRGTRLGRCMLTRVPPGHRIYPHTDVGTHPLHYDTERYYNRYHIVLQCDGGSYFRAEDEVVRMQPGETWWFNNAVEHEVWNDGQTDRIHLIVDIRS